MRIDLDGMRVDDMSDALWVRSFRKYETKEALISTESCGGVERDIMLQIVDAQWKDHLLQPRSLEGRPRLRGYGQRDPLVEYKKESFALFQAMKDRIEEEIVRYLWRLTPIIGDDAGSAAVPRPQAPKRPPQLTMNSPSAAASSPFGAIRGGSAPDAPRPARTGGDDVIKQVIA